MLWSIIWFVVFHLLSMGKTYKYTSKTCWWVQNGIFILSVIILGMQDSQYGSPCRGTYAWKAKVPDLKELKLMAKKTQKFNYCSHVCTWMWHRRIQNYLEEKSGRIFGGKGIKWSKKIDVFRNQKLMWATITWVHMGPWLKTLCDFGGLQIMKIHAYWAEQQGSYH